MANQPNAIPDGLTFDDLLIQPAYSQIVPSEVEVSTRLTRGIQLNIPIVSAAMDTVTEYQTAISMARQGGVGIIHKNMSIALQATEVEKVKKSESGMIVDPVTMEPDRKVHDVLAVMEKFGISGVPIVKGKKLVGIITNRDLRFETDMNKSVEEVMTKDNLVTAKVGINLADSKALLHKNRIEKLLVIDDKGNLKGLITIKDIEKLKKYPLSCKDKLGRLRVGAAVGVVPRGTGPGRGAAPGGGGCGRGGRGPWPFPECDGSGQKYQKAVSGSAGHCRKRGDGRRGRGLDQGRGRRGQGGDRAGVHLHHPDRGRGGRPAGYGHYGLCRGGEKI